MQVIYSNRNIYPTQAGNKFCDISGDDVTGYEPIHYLILFTNWKQKYNISLGNMKPDTWRIEVWSDLYTSLKRKLIKWQIDRNNFFLFLKSYTFFLTRILFFRISSIVFTMTTYINCIILYKYYVDSFNVKKSTNLVYFPWIINYELAEVSKQIIIRLV